MAQPVLTHGTLVLDEFTGRWHVDCEPHVRIRLKRLFGSVAQNAGSSRYSKIALSNTDAVCRDLAWFCDRYPLEISKADRRALRRGANRHKKTREKVLRILEGDFQIPAVEMALPARPYQEQAAAALLNLGHLLVVDELGLGKEQPVDTKVLTPTGWRAIGDLRVGDEVIGSSGRAALVTGVFPQGKKRSYRLRFTDGSSVEAGDDHLWAMRYQAGGRRWQDIVVTTRQLRRGETIERQWASRRTRLDIGKTDLYLPFLSSPVRFARGPRLPVPPYLMGALIANGALAEPSITLTVASWDLDHVLAQLEDEHVDVGAIGTYGSTTHVRIPGLVKTIRALEMDVLSRTKFIPSLYMHASVKARIALLHGLMDGDGSCSAEQNRVTYHTTSTRLAEDVRELVECLGGMASVRSYDRSHEGKPTDYQVRVRLPPSIPPFRLPRKRDRYAPSKRRYPVRRFVDAEYVRRTDSVCIQIDAPDHLYVTEHCIVTHNTVCAIRVMADTRTLPALCVVDSALTDQWKQEIHKFTPTLRVHVIRSREPYDIAQEEGHDPHVIVITYAKLSSWVDHLAGKVRFVAFDEIQELRTGHHDEGASKKNIAAAHVAAQAKYRLGLTASPVYNYGGELFNILDVLAPGRLGTQSEFLREWCSHYTDKRKASVADPAAFGTYIRDLGLMIRRTRDDVGRQLPAVSRVLHEVRPVYDSEFWTRTSAAAELAKTVLDDSAKNLERLQASGMLDSMLRQATGVQKAPHVAAFVRLLLEQKTDKVVLFGWHRAVYDIWAELLEDLGLAWYTGTESPAKKRKEVTRFIEGDANILVMSLRAGRGLNRLQEVCATAVHGELDWSPEVHRQCTGRLHRDGQRRPVFAYYVVSDTGSDPVVSDVLGLKTSQIEGILDPSGAPLTVRDVDPEHIKKLAADYLRRFGGKP